MLKGFVKLGLLTFWRSALPDDQKIIPLLTMDLLECFATETLPEWTAYKNEMTALIASTRSYGAAGKIWPDDQLSGMQQLICDYRLSPAELFLFALLGEVENSHIVNLVIAELQSPDRDPRPSLHTANAMTEALFDEKDPLYLEIVAHPLVKDGFIVLEGEVPLPMQKLKTHPAIWRSLLTDQQPWPGCHFLTAKPELNIGKANVSEAEKLAAITHSSFRAQGVVAPETDYHGLKLQALVVRGNPGSGRDEFAAQLAKLLKRQALQVSIETWQRTPVLAQLCRYTSWLPVLHPQLGPGEALRLNNLQHPVVIILGNEGSVESDNLIEVRMSLPSQGERTQLWQSLTGNKKLSRTLGANALLSSQTILSLGNYARHLANKETCNIGLRQVCEARRHHGADKLRLLAEPVFRDIDANAMVLPPLVEQGLDHLVLRAGKREQLWEGLGKTLKATPNPGVRALFVGESGTGKTLAASYVATRLSAPLYRVDLSSVMNKYIGESEKNLAQLLDEAAANDIVLLFDEADSLFGSRSEGKETGERFANMLTNFLLTRIEDHPGVVMLTTNSKERIDNAFNRRIDVIIDFPLPGYDERLALWRSHLGDRGPGERVYRSLASYCDLAGGQVRNAVLAAAVYADKGKITEENLIKGLEAEYNKLGRKVPVKILQLPFARTA